MATIQFNAYRICEVHANGVSIELTTANIPFPSEKVEEVKRVADAKVLFDAYVDRAKATGQRLQLSAFVRQGRSPTGFDKAFRTPVNVNI